MTSPIPKMPNPNVPLNIVVIGASTGGTRVLQEMFEQLPRLRASVVVVQHIPKFINTCFCATLTRNSAMPVKLAQNFDRLEHGMALLAPSEVHCRISRNRQIQLVEGPNVNYVCPSVDVTMQSLLPPSPGAIIVGVVLTGMGADGAMGVKHIHEIGGVTIAQDKQSCAVFGMPAQAIKTGCVDQILNPNDICRYLVQLLG